MANRVPLSSDAFRQFDRLALVSRRPARAGTGGEHISRRPAPSTDFVDYRPYQPGDDFRRVDWNVYGRLGSLQVKVTEGRERLDVLLVLDCSSSMAFGSPSKLEVAGQLAAALAYIGAAHSDTVRLALLGEAGSNAWWTRPFSRRKRIANLVEELSKVAPVGRVDLDTALAEAGSGTPRNALAVVISDLLSPAGAVEGLDALRGRIADVSIVHLVSPEELEPEISGEVQLVDAESGDNLELGVSLDTLATYRARLQGWLESRADECQRRGMRYVRVQTDRPLASVVMEDLRRGGLLR